MSIFSVSTTSNWRRCRHILLSGYIHEHEAECNISIPDIVHFTTHQYCRELISSEVNPRSHRQFLRATVDLNDSLLDNIAKTEQMQLGEVQLSTKCDEFRAVKHSWSTSFTQHATSLTDNIDAFFVHHKQLNVRIVDIQCGGNHVLFLNSAGDVYSCGANDSGQCGIAEANYVLRPQRVRFPEHEHCTIRCISVGKIHSLFIDEQGCLFVCGFNYCGQLGLKRQAAPAWGLEDDDDDEDMFGFGLRDDNDSEPSKTQWQAPGTPVSATCTAPFQLCASEDEDEEEDEVESDSLSVYQPMLHPFFEQTGLTCSGISCGQYHSVVVTNQGDCYTFGHNAYGNLGNGETREWGDAGCDEPYKLEIDRVKECASGFEHNVLLTDGNDVIVFGDNSHSQCSERLASGGQKLIKSPTKLCKEKEFGIDRDCYISYICCSQNQTLIVYDSLERVERT